jgi:hypothetical protein
MVEQFLLDIPLIYHSTVILFKSALDVKWVVYNIQVGDYSKVHHDKVSDLIVLQVNSQEKTFT